MRKSSADQAVQGLKFFVLTIILATVYTVQAQKTEHYNSPLYAPKTYDPSQGQTSNGLPDALQKIGIEQKLGDQLPLDTEVKDEDGNTVKLGTYFGGKKPVILAFVYYECPMLCNEVLNGLTGSLKGLSFDAGNEFDVVAISFDARENEKPDLAKNKKMAYMERYGRPGSEKGWHFLTGTQDSIDKLTRAAGFSYQWDERSNQFAHAGGIMLTTPDGKLARYFYGIDYGPKDLKFALMESGEGKIGNVAEKLFLYCYHYDPATGKYGLEVLRVMRLGGVATILLLGISLVFFFRRDKNKAREPEAI